MQKRMTACFLGLIMVFISCASLADMQIEDRAGNPIQLSDVAETIISLAPSITQVVIDLGMADKLVAVDTYSMGYEGLPQGLAAFDMATPDVERIIALSPDVVLVSGITLLDGDKLRQLSDLGICVAHIPSSDSVEGILLDILFIGNVIGNAEGAQALNDTLMSTIEALRVDTDEPISVYFEVGSTPSLYSFGSGTFLNEMIELLGGKNIFAELESWISTSDEAVLAANPQVIFTNEAWKADAVTEIKERSGWDSISAIQTGSVFLIDADASSQPNHRIVKALEEMAQAMR